MRKASSIVLLISGILAILGLVAYLVVSIVHFAMGGFLVALQNGTISYADVPQSVWDFVDSIFGSHVVSDEMIAYMFSRASTYLIFALFCIPAAILSFTARGKNSTGLYICCIVFGVLSATGLSIVGGILGLIANGMEKNKEETKSEEPKAVEAPKEEPTPEEEKPEEVQPEEPKVED